MEDITALIDDVAAGLAARDADRCVARFADDVRSVTNVRLVGRDVGHTMTALYVLTRDEDRWWVRARQNTLVPR